MNFRLSIFGSKFDIYDECIKLLHMSACESDYMLDISGFGRRSPYSPIYNTIMLKGSAKKEHTEIIVDFDNLLISDNRKAIIVSPSTVEIELSTSNLHYWAVFGSLIKVIGDISPAYVTGYLIEQKMKKELEVFTTHSNQLPFALKIAVSEFITDII